MRCVPFGTYFARVRVRGKLIRRSLKTDVISVAKLRLTDLEKSECAAAEKLKSAAAGKMTFGDALEIFRQRIASGAEGCFAQSGVIPRRKPTRTSSTYPFMP